MAVALGAGGAVGGGGGGNFLNGSGSHRAGESSPSVLCVLWAQPKLTKIANCLHLIAAGRLKYICRYIFLCCLPTLVFLARSPSSSSTLFARASPAHDSALWT